MPESEKKSLEAASQTEEVLESPKALLEASQQVIELENRLRKQSEEHSELQGKFCGIEEELARITSRTEEAVQEVERERCEKEELVEKLRNMELEKKAAGALEEPPHRPEVEREDGDGASVADEPVLLQPCHGKQLECTGLPITLSHILSHCTLYTAQICDTYLNRPPVSWGSCIRLGLDSSTSFAPAPPLPPPSPCSPPALFSVWFWCGGTLGRSLASPCSESGGVDETSFGAPDPAHRGAPPSPRDQRRSPPDSVQPGEATRGGGEGEDCKRPSLAPLPAWLDQLSG